MKRLLTISLLLLAVTARADDTSVATGPGTYGTNNVFIGYRTGLASTNANNCVLIGDYINLIPDVKDSLVIKFTDGTMFKTKLPPGKVIDLRRFKKELAGKQ